MYLLVNVREEVQLAGVWESGGGKTGSGRGCSGRGRRGRAGVFGGNSQLVQVVGPKTTSPSSQLEKKNVARAGFSSLCKTFRVPVPFRPDTSVIVPT